MANEERRYCPNGHKMNEQNLSIRGVYFCPECCKEYEKEEVTYYKIKEVG